MNVYSYDLNLLTVFQALMTERSVTRASVRLGLSQPAVSNALSRLRDQFGDRLFVWNKKTMVPTLRAMELHQHISAAFEHIGSALQQPQFAPSRSAGVNASS